MKTTTCPLIALAITMILPSLSHAQGQAPGQPAKTAPKELRLVSLFAQGKGKLSADSAVVELHHTAEASTLKAAIDLSLRAKDALKKELVAAGIPTSAIVFQNFSSDSERGRLLGKVKRYRVSSPIQVTVKNESQFAKIAILVDADENLEYYGRKSHISDHASLQVKAAEDAIANLKRKIALYEASFGVKLKLISFGEVSQKQVEEGVHPHAVLTAGDARSRRASLGKPAVAAGYAPSAIAESFGDKEATVYVSGVYQIVE